MQQAFSRGGRTKSSRRTEKKPHASQSVAPRLAPFRKRPLACWAQDNTSLLVCLCSGVLPPPSGPKLPCLPPIFTSSQGLCVCVDRLLAYADLCSYELMRDRTSGKGQGLCVFAIMSSSGSRLASPDVGSVVKSQPWPTYCAGTHPKGWNRNLRFGPIFVLDCLEPTPW